MTRGVDSELEIVNTFAWRIILIHGGNKMKTQRFALILTLLNLALLLFLATKGSRVEAESVPPVLRARAFEIIDGQGRVRAEIKVLPAQPDFKMPDGTTGYPETVLLRLITSKGGPNVKLSASEDGSGMVLGGEPGYVQILSRSKTPFIKLVNKNGREQEIKP